MLIHMIYVSFELVLFAIFVSTLKQLTVLEVFI